MTDRFDYFVIFAEMRTGSNFLEANLNKLGDLVCHGEAFNPHFIAYPNKTEVIGITQKMRDDDPATLVGAIRDQPGVLGGFRFFRDHDPRVLDIALDNPRCAKIILTRNPLDSYVSLKIAQSTGQWKLTDVKRRKDADAVFDGPEFDEHVASLQAFQLLLLNRLQSSGQTAFFLAYEDLQDLRVMNGLAKWLGVDGRLESLDKSLKPQNPRPAAEKVSNPEELVAALADQDRFNLTRTPNFEPRRGPGVPSYVAAVETAVIYLPIRGGPESEVRKWLADLDGSGDKDLLTSMNQKQLRQWKRKHRGHRSFTVLRHPVARAHAVFCTRILSSSDGSYAKIRETLRRQFKLPIPKDEPDGNYSKTDHRAAFEQFLEFVRANIAGQTAIRADATWCTQSALLSGFSELAQPDWILREDELETMLPILAAQVGHKAAPAPAPAAADTPYALSEIYDDALESLVADVYQRDYLMYGFDRWSPA